MERIRREQCGNPWRLIKRGDKRCSHVSYNLNEKKELSIGRWQGRTFQAQRSTRALREARVWGSQCGWCAVGETGQERDQGRRQGPCEAGPSNP